MNVLAIITGTSMIVTVVACFTGWPALFLFLLGALNLWIGLSNHFSEGNTDV